MSTLQIGRTTYDVERVTDNKAVAYRVYGPRGAIYRLCRNAHRPTLLFPVNVQGMTCGALTGKWFQDTPAGPEEVIVC